LVDVSCGGPELAVVRAVLIDATGRRPVCRRPTLAPDGPLGGDG
jgi:hypothetical protein